MKGYIEQRAVELANYIIEKKATVRAAAKKFGISKSTVHTVIAKRNELSSFCSDLEKYLVIVNVNRVLTIPDVPPVTGGVAR